MLASMGRTASRFRNQPGVPWLVRSDSPQVKAEARPHSGKVSFAERANAVVQRTSRNQVI
jgi:hypothetical protein